MKTTRRPSVDRAGVVEHRVELPDDLARRQVASRRPAVPSRRTTQSTAHPVCDDRQTVNASLGRLDASMRAPADRPWTLDAPCAARARVLELVGGGAAVVARHEDRLDERAVGEAQCRT